jgi:microcystin degradation protein MlrC
MDLHGAMEVEEIGDGESDLIKSIRHIIGDKIPIVGSLDLHGNISPYLAKNVDLLTAFRTAPHVDEMQTKERAFKHLISCIRKNIHPRNILIKVPIIMPGEYATTASKPAKSLYAKLNRIDSIKGIMDSSILIGCAWTDSPNTSISVIVVAEDGVNKGSTIASSLAKDIWKERVNFKPNVDLLPAEEAISKAVKLKEHPIFISDSGDNVTAGGGGDLPIMLEFLLRKGINNAVIAGIADRESLERCIKYGCGKKIRLEIGGKLDSINGQPLSVLAKINKIRPSTTAVINISGVSVIITSERKVFTNLSDFRDAGIDPLRYKIIVVKLGYLFSELQNIAKKSIIALTPGFTDFNLKRFSYRRIKRPIYPLDGDFEWSPD